MADIGSSLRTYLLTKATIETLVGQRIIPDPIDQGVPLPAICYFTIDSISAEDLSNAVGLGQTRVQIDCYAAKRAQANQLQEAVRTAIQGYRGKMGLQYVHGVTAGSTARDQHDAPTDGSDRHRYLRSRDYLISHEE